MISLWLDEVLRKRIGDLFGNQVVGLSRDDVPTVVQAGSTHPGSQRRPTFIIRKPHQAFCDCWSRISCFLQTCALPARRFPPPWTVEEGRKMPISRPHCDTKCSQRSPTLLFEGGSNPLHPN